MNHESEFDTAKNILGMSRDIAEGVLLNQGLSIAGSASIVSMFSGVRSGIVNGSQYDIAMSIIKEKSNAIQRNMDTA